MKQLINFLKQSRYFLFLVFSIGFLVDIFVFKTISDLFILFLIILWTGTVIGFRLESRFSILTGIIFLITSCLFLLVKAETIAQKLAIWAYMFLVFGIIQQLVEYKKRPQGLINLDNLWSKLKNNA